MSDEFTQKTSASRIILMIVGVILLFTLGIYIGFDLGQKSTSTESTNTVTSELATVTEETATHPATISDTADWKTYTDEKYGFSFKYPSDYTLMRSEGCEGLCAVTILFGKKENNDISKDISFRMSFLDHNQNISLNEFASDEEKGLDVTKKEDITMNNVPGIKYYIGGLSTGYHSIAVQDKYSVAFDYYYVNGQIDEQLFNDISNTFNFPSK